MRFFAILLGLLYYINAWSQHDIRGVVNIDSESVIGAHVEIVELDKATITEVDGSFLFSDIPNGSYNIKVSYIGATELTHSIELTSSIDLNLVMELDRNQLEEVTIRAKSTSRELSEKAIEIESVSIKEVSSRVKDITEVIHT